MSPPLIGIRVATKLQPPMCVAKAEGFKTPLADYDSYVTVAANFEVDPRAVAGPEFKFGREMGFEWFSEGVGCLPHLDLNGGVNAPVVTNFPETHDHLFANPEPAFLGDSLPPHSVKIS